VQQGLKGPSVADSLAPAQVPSSKPDKMATEEEEEKNKIRPVKQVNQEKQEEKQGGRFHVFEFGQDSATLTHKVSKISLKGSFRKAKDKLKRSRVTTASFFEKTNKGTGIGGETV